MKIVYQAWLLFLTVVGSSLISSLILHLAGGGGFAMFMFGFILFTIVFGVPCSLIIRIVIRRKDRRGDFLRGVLHVIAGYAILFFKDAKELLDGDWVDVIDLIRSGMPVIFAVQAAIFYAVYVLVRYSLRMDDPMWEEEQSIMNEAVALEQ